MGSNGRPEPTSAVAAVVLLGLGSCAAFFFLLAMRWATWAVLGVLAHLAMRKPNVSDSLLPSLGSAAAISAASSSRPTRVCAKMCKLRKSPD